MTVSDTWQSSTTNSNTNDQSFYFSSLYDFNNANQYHHTTDNNHCNYQPSSDIFPNSYSINPYPIQSVAMAPSIDSYQNLHPIYTDPSASSSMDIQFDYQSQWDLGPNKTPSHNGMYNKLAAFHISTL